MDFKFSKTLNGSTILFPDNEIQRYYNEIAENKSRGLRKEDALECFGQMHSSMDAIISLLYDEKVHYDVVLQVSNKNNSSDAFYLQNLYIMELLKFGCIISRENSPLNKNVGVFLVLMPFWRLVDEAERIQLKLPLKSHHFDVVKARFWGANKRPIFGIDRWRARDLYAEVKTLNGRFSSTRMKYFLNQKGKTDSELFSSAQRNLLSYNILHRIIIKLDDLNLKQDSERLDLDGLVNLNVFTTYYPLHDGQADKSLANPRSILNMSWKGWLSPQPVHLIRSYFGEQIAFHFAWMDHATWWMFILGIIGVFVFFYGLVKAIIINKNTINTDTLKTIRRQTFYSTVFDNEMTIVFGFITSLWGLAQVKFWKRRSNYLSVFWTTDKYLVEEAPRPLWKSTERTPNPITGELEPHFPTKQVIKKRMFSFLGIIATFLLLALNVMLYVIYNSAIRTKFAKDISISKYSSLVSAVISFITIQILSPVCSYIALKLNDYENHKTSTEYYDSLIAKRLTFDFVNYYGIITYLAVVHVWVQAGIFGQASLIDGCFNADPTDPSAQSCMMDLTIQMGVIFVARAQVRHLFNYLEPVWTRFVESIKYGGLKASFNSLGSKYSYKSSLSSNIPQLYSDMTLTSVDNWQTSLDGYESATVQFGFIILFSVSFPLAPILATVHNIIQWRIDANNLLIRYKRPFAQQAASIGVWDDWLVFLAYLGIAMNALILSFTSDYMFTTIAFFSEKTNNEQWFIRLVFVLVFEHAVLLANLLIHKLISHMPERAIVSLKRQAYIEKFLSGEMKELS